MRHLRWKRTAPWYEAAAAGVTYIVGPHRRSGYFGECRRANDLRNSGSKRIGQSQMAITHGRLLFVFGIVVLATLLIAAPAAHAACRSPKNICKHLDECLQRTSDPNNKDADGIRAGVKARNGQIVSAVAEACARDLGKKKQWDEWARGCSELEFFQMAKVGLEPEKPIATATHNSKPLGGVWWRLPRAGGGSRKAG
jgi:hypothetical protein